jgi:hypothetical protein
MMDFIQISAMNRPLNGPKQAFKAKNKKGITFSIIPFFRGPERIRTAVGAFAELCLATRPQDLFMSVSAYPPRRTQDPFLKPVRK